MIFHLLIRLWPVLAQTERIKLKIVDDDRFLGMVGGRAGPVPYEKALAFKLGTMKDISLKNMELKDGTALTETRTWWIFSHKKYRLRRNEKNDRQTFRIVYYAPNEYLLMRDDECLGFIDQVLKLTPCRTHHAARFRICYSKTCDSYVDVARELGKIKHMLKGHGHPHHSLVHSGWGGHDDDDDDESEPHSRRRRRMVDPESAPEEDMCSLAKRSRPHRCWESEEESLSHMGFRRHASPSFHNRMDYRRTRGLGLTKLSKEDYFY